VTLSTVRLDGDGSSVEVATAFGPRIVGLLVDGRNLFAELPDDTLTGPGGRPYRLRGGHRLWAAPEVPDVTYQPDDEPCVVSAVGDGVQVDAPPDGAGLAKAIVVAPATDGWSVDHTIVNLGASTMTVAPWAITQLRPGGRFTLAFAATGDGLQADRSFVLWPYTDPTDARLSVTTDAVTVDAAPLGSPLKVGVAGAAGRGRYELEGTRFEKRIAMDRSAPSADLGAVVQVYVCPRFGELETLGSLTQIPPGASVTHRESWTIA
jgi:hypothetical protein